MYFFACKIFCLHCVSIDSVSHHSSFMNGYNKTGVNPRSHNRSRECKKTLTHRCRVENNLHCESSPVARGEKQKNVELAPLACKKLALVDKGLKSVNKTLTSHIICDVNGITLHFRLSQFPIHRSYSFTYKMIF